MKKFNFVHILTLSRTYPSFGFARVAIFFLASFFTFLSPQGSPSASLPVDLRDYTTADTNSTQLNSRDLGLGDERETTRDTLNFKFIHLTGIIRLGFSPPIFSSTLFSPPSWASD